MHRIFNRLANEVWRHNKIFCVPLEQKRAPEPLTNHPKRRKKIMPTAFILLNTEIGAVNQVLKALKDLDGVEEAHGLWGVYDIIVNVQADTMDELKEIISKRIENVGQINSKLTMIVSERSPLSLMKPKPKETKTTINREPMPILA